ncbi:IS4 family transposase [Silvimonas sp.]|uniref:IS4 family transposase n=1 Tax=Silvimonas sp. TaxID=2650811 RepID=UPI00284002D0|nr:IS4 family transposase [Silvimonas sp.]MDR3427739.1 IS4 family transposase [Silvimonas sp.]
MHAIIVLQDLLRRYIPTLHEKRLSVLIAAVGSCLRKRRLSLSELARGLESATTVRHRIKRIDRLLGNRWFQAQRVCFYQMLCKKLIAIGSEPIILVDWSDLKPDRSLLLLRATLWTHRHALVLYEEIHPMKRQNSPQVEREFLLTLKSMLWEGVCPIIVTDAGFRGPWFVQVQKLGWHWVGRVRGRTFVSVKPGRWLPCKRWFARATATPVALGVGQMVRARPVDCALFLYHKPPKGRSSKTLRGQRRCSNESNKCANREREPWLLAASLSLTDLCALEVVSIYRTRMRIEQTFRVLKSRQFGFGFEDSRSRTAGRIAVLLLVNALAVLLAWIAGNLAYRKKLELQFQSHGNRKRRSMSVVTLGWMALADETIRFACRELTQALDLLSEPPPLYADPPLRRS